MTPLTELLALSQSEKRHRGLLYTPAEIAQQPKSWLTTHRLFQESRKDLAAFLQRPHADNWTIYLVGAGTSDYAGHSIANLLRRRWNCEVSVVASTDLLTSRDDLLVQGRDYLWISFSRSGDSPEGVAVLEQALSSLPKVRHLVVSCNKDGQMAKLAQENENCFAMLLDDSVNDRSLAMTSSFTNTVLFGQELAHLWDSELFEEILDRMMLAGEYFLREGSELAYSLTEQNYRKAFYIGAGPLAAIAKESALKMLELTSGGVRTMYETTLGLRHGPMSALDTETLFTAFLAADAKRRKYELDLLKEIRAKQIVRTIVGVGDVDAASDYSLHCPPFDQLEDVYRPTVAVIFGQLLGLFSSIKLGLKPDSPSPNSVINRVVERFTIHS